MKIFVKDHTPEKKYSIKYLVSGHIIEKYEYERMISRGNKEEKTGGRHFKADEEAHEKHRKETLQKARNTIRRMVNANQDMKTFLTLTYAENIDDIAYSNGEFKKFIQRMQYKFENNFKYVAVIEFQKRGAIHYHIICNLPIEFKVAEWRTNKKGQRYRRKTEQQKEFENSFRDRYWKHGNVDIRPLIDDEGKEVDNVGAYICKYMTEDLSDKRLNGKKTYLNSKNLNEPLEITLTEKEIDALESAYNLSKQETALKNTYYNDYIGKMEYKQYNLKRLGLFNE